eukprot:CAMPEP_0168467382 /NCGR_PEP_ID=MMETSP0228-20121227/57153_2 /TAXON_ID=133427 /ORGANISM="Protoceratium reticulatum, Strain CCCM 535 (=CCMP 1889)" /LENGTH=67 /DNA_ID= /DNA_START= /DNA_END= /DNA_ORIENTATION=
MMEYAPQAQMQPGVPPQTQVYMVCIPMGPMPGPFVQDGEGHGGSWHMAGGMPSGHPAPVAAGYWAQP